MSVKCSGCGHEHEDWVPKSRLDTITEQRKAAKAETKQVQAKVAELEGQLADAGNSASTIENLNTQIADFQKKEARWALTDSIRSAGINDPEGVTVAATLWDALEDKPSAGIGDWLASDGAPKAVKAYLTVEQAAGADEEANAAPTAAPDEAKQGQVMPNSNNGVKQDASASGQFSAARIAQMSPAEYAANRSAIRAGRGLAPLAAE